MTERGTRRSVLDKYVFDEPEEKYGCGFRHNIAVLTLLAALVCYIQRFSFGLILPYMVTMSHVAKQDPHACPHPATTESPKSKGLYDWNQSTQGYLTLAFFVGYVISPFIGGYLADRFGPKHVLGICMILSTLATFLAPVFVYALDWGGLAGVRFFIGLVQGPIYPCLSVVLSQWSPKTERGVMGTLMFAGAQLGIVVAFVTTPYLVDYWDWSAPFYAYGIVSVIWVIAWYIMFHNSPRYHPWISEKEKNYILQNTGRTGIKDLPPTPWKPIMLSVPVWALVLAQFGHDWGLFTIVTDLPKYFRQVLNFNIKELPPTPWKPIMLSVPVWALVLAQFGHDWGLFTIVTDLPKYFRQVLNFNIKENGAYSAAPYLVMWIFAVGFAYLSDWMTGPKQMNVTFVRKLLITIAVGPAIGIIGGSYVGCSEEGAVAFFTIGMGTMGAFVASLKVNPVDLSPNYAGVVTAVVNGLGSTSGILAPYTVGAITKDATIKQWRIVFWITFAILVITSIIYIIWGTAKVQPWNVKREMKPEGVA